ncbi:MAG: GldG family protein, partial [Acidobacteriota bacterium]
MDEQQQPRPWLDATTLSAGVVIVLALFAMVNYLSMRHYERLDITGSKLYTLTEKSKTVLRDLDRDVDLVVLINPGSELYVTVDELLDRYVAINPERITRRDLDAARDLLELQQLIDQYGIERDNVIVVATETDKRVIGSFELATYDYSGAQYGQPPAIDEFRGEQQITSAILSLVETDKKKLYFTTGHGEPPLEALDLRALSQAEDLLKKDNFEVDTWSPLGADAVPADADAVIIAGPTTNFLDPEVELLRRYVADGGRVLALLDPVFDAQGTSTVRIGLEDWLGELGVDLRPDLVLDPSAELAYYGAETLFTDSYGEHPTVAGLARSKTRVLMPLVRSVSVGSVPTGGDVTELVLTSPDGWGETDFQNLESIAADGDDLRGPVPIAVAAVVPPGGAPSGIGADEGDDGAEPAADAATLDAPEESAGDDPSDADGGR